MRARRSAIGSPGSAREVSDLQDRRDRGLIARVAARDEDGFRELYRRYAPVANGLAYRILADATLSEEVVQEVFLSVWDAGSFDPARGSVRSWLLAQVHHRAVDVVRREEAHRRRNLEHGRTPADDPIDDVVERGWMTVRQRHVRRALDALTPEQRTAIEMAYFDGLTQRQIAERTRVPLGTVKSRTLAAMRALRGVLGSAE